MGETFGKIERFEAEEQRRRQTHRIDLDLISEKIAIVRSNSYEGEQMLSLINDVKHDLQFGRVDPAEQKYWKDIKEAAESLIQEWEEKNADIIAQHERKYLEMKLGKSHSSHKEEEKAEKVQYKREEPKQQMPRVRDEAREEIKARQAKIQVNLLDL